MSAATQIFFMLTKTQKQEIIEELTDKLKRQKSLIFTDFRGLKVGEMQDLRNKLRDSDIEYKVAKKTLIKLAIDKAKKVVDTNQFESSVALAFGYKDPITPAKVISAFTKEHKNLQILGGLMEDKFLTIEEVKELAKIPSRDELLVKLTCSLKSPISGFVNVLQGNIRNLVGILVAIKNHG